MDMRGLAPHGWSLLVALVAGCGDPPTDPTDRDCAEAEARLGFAVCLHTINDGADWSAVSIPVDLVDQDGATKYFVAASPDAELASMFIDVSWRNFHLDFLVEAFPDRFPSLGVQEYYDLVLFKGRHFYVGGLTDYLLAGGGHVYGFTIADGYDAENTVSCDDARNVYNELGSRFAFGNLAMVAMTSFQADMLAGCDVPVHAPANLIEYEAYNVAEAFGTLRRFDAAGFTQAVVTASFGWQDILVLDQAPPDIERVIAGAVTGTRQSPLSHLNVRLTNRGTPSCYQSNAFELLQGWEGTLVRVQCGQNRLEVRQATSAEAQVWWDSFRPDPLAMPTPDLTFADLTPLLDLGTSDAAARSLARARYGAKGSNLATLYQRIDPALRFDGFLIPFRYYDEFMNAGVWTVDFGTGPEALSFAATVSRMAADNTFVTDGAFRRQLLAGLRGAMRGAPCEQQLVADLQSQIVTTFGDATTMVRFRSSSNAEDGLFFNGAGIYDSTSACAADEADADFIGPSLCDPEKTNERDLCRAMRKVWASVWNVEAYEERDWFGMDHTKVAMGILVNNRTKNEQANIVAFSGNPVLAGDTRYLINAQVGWLDVVSSAPGVVAEQILLTVESGQVTAIERVVGSSEVPIGDVVLDDGRLRELGAALAVIADVYPLDAAAPANGRTLLDTEWKVTPAGRLVVKQVRPFLDE